MKEIEKLSSLVMLVSEEEDREDTASGGSPTVPKPSPPYHLDDPHPEEREDIDDPVQYFLDAKKIRWFEGESGVRNLETLVETLDRSYRDMQSFLADNPGACNAIVDFITEWADRNDQWKENLIKAAKGEEEEEEEEE